MYPDQPLLVALDPELLVSILLTCCWGLDASSNVVNNSWILEEFKALLSKLEVTGCLAVLGFHFGGRNCLTAIPSGIKLPLDIMS